MCIGPRLFNLCLCGCTEGEHEEDYFGTLISGLTEPIFDSKPNRKKCRGRKLVMTEPQVPGIESAPTLVDCNCTEFRPAWDGWVRHTTAPASDGAITLKTLQDGYASTLGKI